LSDTDPVTDAALKRGRFVKLSLLLLAVLGLNFGGSWLAQQIDFQLFPRHDSMLQFMVLGAVLLYLLLMTIPFMPGIEIGLALMLLMGSKGALLVYLCTVAALSISFVIGRRLPPRLIIKLLNWLHLYRAGRLLTRLEPMDQQQRLQFLYQKAPRKLLPILLKHRYLAVIVMLNLPGNALIGGGGGICMIAGMSRLFPFPVYLLLLAIAVAPVPLLFYFELFQG
jgi:hypothetical protein